MADQRGVDRMRPSHTRTRVQNGLDESPTHRSSSSESDDSTCTVIGKDSTPAQQNVRGSVKSYLTKSSNWRWVTSDVRPYKDAPSKRMIAYNVVKVVSPTEFYLRCAYGRSCITYEDLFQAIQEFYAVEENRNMLKLQHGHAFRGRCYVCQDPNDGKWYRVRVYDINRKGNIVTAFFVDEAKFQEVPYKNLLEIHPSFTRFAYQVFACYLYDVLPKGAQGLKWSEDAINHFRNLVTGKDLIGICMARSDALIKRGFPDIVNFMGMILYDKQNAECTINARMVDDGYCDPIGIFGGCKHALEFPNFLPEFDIKTFRTEFGIPEPPPEDIPITPVIVDQDESDYVEVLRPEMNWQTPQLLNESVTLDYMEHGAPYANTTEYLPEQFTDHLACVKTSFVLGPSSIILHLKSRMTAMKEMQNALKTVVENQSLVAIDEIKPGDFMACLIITNDAKQGDDNSIWCRGIVRSTDPVAQNVKLLLADYCNEVFVKLPHCRRLPPFFETIPSFAIRCHLDSWNVLPLGQNGWSGDACNFFRQYVFTWEKSDPVYFMFRRTKDCINLMDFTQDVSFNFLKKSWIAGPEKKLHSHAVINERRNHPMLYSLYRSCGVELFYEVVVQKSPFWYFENMVDCLVRNGFAKYKGTSKRKNEIHRDIMTICKLRRVIRMAKPKEDNAFVVSVQNGAIKVSSNVRKQAK